MSVTPTLRKLILACVLLLAKATVGAAATFQVDSTADDVDAAWGDGSCAAADGSCTLRAAIEETNALPSDDVIRVPAGNYASSLGALVVTPIGPSRTGRLRIIGDRAQTTIVDGSGTDLVFAALDATHLQLKRLTIRGGASVGSGGGVWSNGPLTIRRCIIEDNSAAEGGGVFADSGGRFRMFATTVRNNDAVGPFATGGGVLVLGGGKIERSTVTDNSTTVSPPMLLIIGGRDVMATRGGSLHVVNSTIAGEISTLSDGFIGWEISGTAISLRNATADEVTYPWWFGSGGSFAARNSAVGRCASPLVSGGYNVIGNVGFACYVTGDTTGLLLDVDPMLGPLTSNGGPTPTRLPLPGSPLIDGGSLETPGSGGAACERIDQRGVLRPKATRCDLGAAEAE